MNINIVREMHLNNFAYKINGCDFLSGKAKFTYGFMPRKIAVFNNDGNIWELKQTNWLSTIINSFPILNVVTFTPFKCYINDCLYGKTKKLLFKTFFSFKIKEDSFMLAQHSNNYFSLMKNDIQIALYKKKSWAELEKNEYEIKYNDTAISLELILLFCIFIDVVFYPNHFKVSYSKYEKVFVINDPFKERVNWSPN